MTGPIHGLVLAAGRSDRAGGPKALASIEGETFVARAVRILREGGCSEVWVVVGRPWGTRIAESLSDGRIVENPDPDRGMMSSLQVGLSAALTSSPAPMAVVFSLVDHPRVSADIVQRLVDHARVSSDPVVRPTAAGKPGHPVLITAEVARKLIDVSSLAIVREALAEIGKIYDLEIDDVSVLDDADTSGAIRALGGAPADE